MVGRGRHRHLRALIVAATLAFGAAAGGCGSAPAAPKRAETYVDRVAARVLATIDEVRFVLRHNPAGECGCPPFEVKLGDRWQRVEIGGEEDDPAIVALRQVAEAVPGGDRDAAARDRRLFEVEARLDEGVALCGRGGLYVSLVPTAFVGVVGTTPEVVP